MLSKQSLDILIDLVENKLSTMYVDDPEDMRELMRLKRCRNELVKTKGQFISSNKAKLHNDFLVY